MKRTTGLLALSLVLGLVSQAYAVADRTETERAKMYRGTNNGEEGYWLEYVTRTFRFIDDPFKVAARDAFLAAYKREPNDQELAAFVALKPIGANVPDTDLAAIAVNVAAGRLTLDQAKLQLAEIKRLANENRNSDYLTTLPAQYLNWAPGKPLSQTVIDQVGAEPREWQNRFVNAYNGIDVNPDTKVFTGGPLKGQKLSSDFNTMVNQLTQNGYITFDWNYDTLLNDLGGQGALDSYGQGRGFWASNLFGKDNLHDATLFQRYSSREGMDATTRIWNSYDGVGRFNTWNDLDVLMAVNYSTAAKLVAESKALRAMGLSAQADAKVNQARNVVLLDGNDHDPLVLDLNQNGKIDVTGVSSAKYRAKENRKFVKDGAIQFDLLANGRPITTEWIKDGDGFLVDNRKNAAVAAIQSGKGFTGANLFGDIEGFPGGFLKLATLFDAESRLATNKARLTKGFGVLKGAELNNLMVWIDNGDGVAKLDELKTLPSLGITEIGVLPKWVKNEKGEMMEQTYFVQNGKKHLIQEVWFMGE